MELKQLNPQYISHVLESKCLVQKQDKLLVAVSGGADSLAVLQLLQHAGYDIAAAHCNFRLRAEASDADEALVGEFCKD
ncbi:MAG: hypothetical protein N4A74_09065, partial [Carboxylicivirga sp.]|nr:hypothetical protein [Carboxylicivirga sp.]